MQMIIVSMSVLTTLLLMTAIIMAAFGGDTSRSRLKAIRAKRQHVRDDQAKKAPQKVSLKERITHQSFAARMSERLRLNRLVNMDKLKMRLLMAGWRDPATLPKFLLVHLVLPLFLGGYVFWAVYSGPLGPRIPQTFHPVAVLGGVVLGLMLPSIMLKNAATNRVIKLQRQFPDALDLMLVCVEAGLAVDQSFMRVTEEIGHTIPEIAEEFALTGAELAFLGDRPQAYQNMVTRTGQSEFKSLSTALSQSEAYGTSVGGALRALSEDSRKMRMMGIEKQAGGLGPKMTIPMIIFILPCMFLVLIGPSIIQVMGLH